jgi:nucleotide-binding universal stress UspA family protein
MCAVDASEQATDVVATGARLAALLDAPLVLFHVARAPGLWHRLENVLHPDRQAENRGEGRALLQQHAAGVPGAATLELATGEPAEEVLTAAEDVDPQLLVLGSHGRGALRALLGSVTRDVTRWSSRPTLVVPDSEDDRLLAAGPVLCGLDESEQSQRAAVTAGRIANALASELVLASVLDVIPTSPSMAASGIPAPPLDSSAERQSELRDRAEQVAERLPVEAPVRTVVEVGDPAGRLAALGDEFDAGLIAVGSVDRSPLTAALSGAVASDLIRLSSRPVLLVP